MMCFCKTSKGAKCSKNSHPVTVGENKKADLCPAHHKVFRNKGLDGHDFHTQPYSTIKNEEQELPFKMSRIDEILAAEKARAELEEAASKSRVIDTINEGEPGVHKSPLFIIAGTGSRSLQKADLATKEQAKALVTTAVMANKEKYGDNLVIMSGMAEGFDKLLAYVAIECEVKLWCAIPNRGYADYYWGRHSLTGSNQLAGFNAITRNAWRVTYVMEDIHHQTRGLYIKGRHSNFVRNDFMVEKGNAFLVWDPTSSGTSDCLASIKATGKPYKILSPQPE